MGITLDYGLIASEVLELAGKYTQGQTPAEDIARTLAVSPELFKKRLQQAGVADDHGACLPDTTVDQVVYSILVIMLMAQAERLQALSMTVAGLVTRFNRQFPPFDPLAEKKSH